MSSIDERVVEMRFDNKQFESNMQTTLGSLDKLRQALKFDNAGNGLKSVEDGARKIDLSSIQSSLDNISSKFTAFGILGVETFRRVANAAIDLGQKMATAVTTEPLKQGFAEYELQMNSVKTIMASTGKDVDTVNGYLDELNTYADKTIYSFSDMTSNIGKFTNAGVDLDLAVKAIQGISNEAAVSGANTNEASRAMYNFAQALSAGYVKLIDWKSIENANMATVEFKNQLLETALACGTVERTSDGMYRTLTTNAKGKVSEAFDATHSFNDALANQWMTTEVLTQTLAKYADETTDIGKKAFAAAQDVTTFSQLIDTTKEALGSGWTKTFQYLIGNFDEAKELWTSVSKAINGVVDSTSDARNELLKSWNELGGRRHLIQALGKAFNYLAGIMHPVKVAFREIFPAVTVKNLMDLTKHIWRFTDSLKLSVASGSNVYKTFRGLFSAVDIVKQAFVAVIRVIADTVKGFTGVGDGVLGVTGKLGDFIYGLRNALKENDTFYKGLKRVADFIVGVLSKAFDILKTAAAGIESAFHVDLRIPTFEEAVAVFKNLTKVLEPLKNALDKAKESIKGFFDSISNGLFGPKPDTGQVEETVSIFTRIGTAVQNLWNQIKPLLDPIKNGFKTIFGSFLDPLGHVDFNKVFSAISGGAFSGVAIKIFEIFNNFKKSTDGIKDGFENFGEILDGLKGSLENFQQGVKAKALKDIAIAVGILSASLVILSGVDDQKLASGLMTISGMLAALLGTFTLFSDMTKTLKPGNMAALAGSMIPLSVAVGILVISLRGLASLDIGQLAKGLVGVGVLMLEVGAAAAVLGRLKLKGFMSAATSMIMLGVAIRTLVKPVAILGSIDYGVLQQGLEGVGKLLASLAIFAFFAKFGKVGISTGAGILLVAEAIKVLSLSVAAFGYTPVDVVNQGLGAVAALLAELAIFSVITGNAKHVLSTAASMVVLSAALEIMAGVINATGTMNYDQMSQGLGAIASTLIMMSVALLATKNALPGAAALIVTAGALAILTPVLMALGKLTLPEIGKGLLAIGGALAIVGVAGALLGPAALGVVALAGGIALIGVGVAAAGAGLLMLSAAFASVGASATVFAGSMVAAVSIVITGLLGIIPQIVQIVGATISGIVSIIATNGPIIVATAIGIASMIIGGIGILLPQLVNTGIKIVLSILDGISQNIEKITTLAVVIIIKFANGISSMMDALVQAGINLMVNFINGMANGIRNNTKVILSAVGNLMGAIVEFSLTALQSIVKNIPLIGDELSAGLETVKGEVRTRFSPEEMQQIGADGMGGVATGIRDSITDTTNAANEVGDAALAALEEKKPLYSQTSSGSVMEYATGFINSKKDVVDSVSGLNDDAIAGLKVPDEYANVGDINVNALLEKMRGKSGDASKVGEDIKKPILDTLTDEAGFNTSGTTNMTAYLEGANSKATEAKTTGTTISTAVTTGLESQIPAQKTAGETGGQTYSDAVKSKEPEAKAAAETISTAVTKRMDEEVPKHKEEGTKSGDAYKQSILDKETEIVDAVDTVTTSATDKLEEKVPVYEEKGEHSAEGYRTSIENKKEDITKTAEEVADSAVEGMDSKYDRFVQVGEHATMGFVEGMKNKIREAARAAAEIAAAAYEAAMDELDENSPSKVFMGIGEYAGEGMVIGLNNMAEDASDSGRNLAGGAIESARKAIAQISKALDEDLDTVPTIAPVLDLTNIQNGVGRLKGMLGQTTYGINAVGTANVTNRSEGFANAIAEALRRRQQPLYINNTNRMILDGKVIAESVNVNLGGMI